MASFCAVVFSLLLSLNYSSIIFYPGIRRNDVGGDFLTEQFKYECVMLMVFVSFSISQNPLRREAQY